jgi:hypothetical protein
MTPVLAVQRVVQRELHVERDEPCINRGNHSNPFQPPAMSKRTAKKAAQQARDTFYATAEVALHADEFNAFGKTVPAKLWKMSDIQRHIAERIISDVLFRGGGDE